MSLSLITMGSNRSSWLSSLSQLIMTFIIRCPSECVIKRRLSFVYISPVASPVLWQVVEVWNCPASGKLAPFSCLSHAVYASGVRSGLPRCSCGEARDISHPGQRKMTWHQQLSAWRAWPTALWQKRHQMTWWTQPVPVLRMMWRQLEMRMLQMLVAPEAEHAGVPRHPITVKCISYDN